MGGQACIFYGAAEFSRDLDLLILADPGCTTVVQERQDDSMPQREIRARKRKAKPVRQSVTVPGALATEVRRVAKEADATMSRAIVTLAERGVRTELEASETLKAAYRRFRNEKEPARKEEPGEDLIRAIFGKDAIAEGTLRRSSARPVATSAGTS